MSDPQRRIALIGLGNMGAPIGSRWVQAGHDVVGFDLSAAAVKAFTDAGGRAAASAAEATRGADVIVLLLPDSNVVDAVIAQLLDEAQLAPGTMIIDMSSSDPERSRDNGARLRALDIAFLDAPVSGGVRGAESGRLTIMVGGSQSDFAAHEELLTHLGRVVHVGDVGAGHAVKALNNLLSAVHLWATSEAVFVGERFGVEPATLLEVVNGSSGRSGSSEAKWPNFILTETYDSGFSARLMLKDARIAVGLAESVGLPTHLGEELVREWSKATDDLSPTADHTEIARWLRDRALASANSPA